MALRILVLGGGGREHALVWKLQQSTLVSQIFVCPGNGGTELSPKVSNLNLPDPSFQTLVSWAVANDVSMPGSHFCLTRSTRQDQSRHSRPRTTVGRWSRVVFSQRCLAFHTSTLHSLVLRSYIYIYINSRDPYFWPKRSRSAYGRFQSLLKGVYDPTSHTHCCLSCICFVTSRRGDRVCQDVWPQGRAKS